MSPFQVLLHPVRWRIVQSLTAGPKTVREIRNDILDVPQATLYRQIQPLLDAEIIEVTGEVQARGVVERTYALRALGLPSDAMDVDGHRRAFAFLQAAQLGGMDRYLSADDADPEQDGVSYTHTTLHLDEEQRGAFMAELRDFVGRYLGLASPSGRPLGVGSTMIPGPSPRP